MLFALAWQDHAVIVGYLALTLLIGYLASRRQETNDEYFLASRGLPWFAVGLSVLATLLSSLTYLSEPGEVWRSGVMNFLGKMLAIPVEMYIVWAFFIPFLMRFRFTSAYEYLEFRFNYPARLLGTTLFCCMTIAWMGLVVLMTSRALTHVTGMPLWAVIATVGVVATIYTTMGGLRAVVWTDALQMLLMLAGAIITMVFVARTTNSGPLEWYRGTMAYRLDQHKPELEWFSGSPFTRATVLTVALQMFLWHLCTHSGNQMTVQRYFATKNIRRARRAFITASLAGVVVNAMLMMVGLALVYFCIKGPGKLPSAGKEDELFPLFMVQHLPPGWAGAVLAAVLAAAMSSIDSGINSLATVLCVEGARKPPQSAYTPGASRLKSPGDDGLLKAAKWITVVAGLAITLVAMALDRATGDRNIVDMMPRSFNCFTAPMGGMFLIGIFLPFVTGRAIVPATVIGLASGLAMAYAKPLGLTQQDISFTWIVPGSMWIQTLCAIVFSLLDRPQPQNTFGLTWFTRHQAFLMAVPTEDARPAALQDDVRDLSIDSQS